MATQMITNCDFCGTQKTSLNHWMRIRSDAAKFEVLPWSEKAELDERHACSDSEVVNAMQEWLSQQQEKGISA